MGGNTFYLMKVMKKNCEKCGATKIFVREEGVELCLSCFVKEVNFRAFIGSGKEILFADEAEAVCEILRNPELSLREKSIQIRRLGVFCKLHINSTPPTKSYKVKGITEDELMNTPLGIVSVL